MSLLTRIRDAFRTSTESATYVYDVAEAPLTTWRDLNGPEQMRPTTVVVYFSNGRLHLIEVAGDAVGADLRVTRRHRPGRDLPDWVIPYVRRATVDMSTRQP